MPPSPLARRDSSGKGPCKFLKKLGRIIRLQKKNALHLYMLHFLLHFVTHGIITIQKNIIDQTRFLRSGGFQVWFFARSLQSGNLPWHLAHHFRWKAGDMTTRPPPNSDPIQVLLPLLANEVRIGKGLNGY